MLINITQYNYTVWRTPQTEMLYWRLNLLIFLMHSITSWVCDLKMSLLMHLDVQVVIWCVDTWIGRPGSLQWCCKRVLRPAGAPIRPIPQTAPLPAQTCLHKKHLHNSDPRQEHISPDFISMLKYSLFGLVVGIHELGNHLVAVPAVSKHTAEAWKREGRRVQRSRSMPDGLDGCRGLPERR